MTAHEKMQKKFSFVDVFAGPGGLSIGFKLSGYFEPVAAVEIAKVACSTYEQNMGLSVFHENLGGNQSRET